VSEGKTLRKVYVDKPDMRSKKLARKVGLAAGAGRTGGLTCFVRRRGAPSAQRVRVAPCPRNASAHAPAAALTCRRAAAPLAPPRPARW
jgi:hypothetical protein